MFINTTGYADKSPSCCILSTSFTNWSESTASKVTLKSTITLPLLRKKIKNSYKYNFKVVDSLGWGGGGGGLGEKGGGGWGISVKVPRVIVGNFEKILWQVPEYHFVGVARINVLP